jgi:polysaccharide pyruvyl transferase CsaB
MNTLLLGYYGSRNLGDDMMMACLVDALQTQNAAVTVVSEDPVETQSRFGIRAIQNVPLLGEWGPHSIWLKGLPTHLIREIWNTEALVVGGGDLIRDDLNWRVYFYTVEKILLALLLGRLVYLVNVGIPRPRTWYGRLCLRAILRRCQAVIVRDTRSVELCREYAPDLKCVHAPDIVMHLPEMMYGSHSAAPAPKTPTASDTMVVCLRGQPNIYGHYSIDQRHIEGLAKCLDHCIERHGLRVVFLPFQQGDEWGDDPLHQQVLAAMKRSESVTLRKWTGDFMEVMECVGNARLVLAMRLHAAILALALWRPCVLMPYDQKLDELGKQFGLKPVIRPEDLEDPTGLMRALDTFLEKMHTPVTHGYEPSWKKTVFHYFFTLRRLNRSSIS